MNLHRLRAGTARIPNHAFSMFTKNSITLQRLQDLVEILPGFSTGSALEHDDAGTHQMVLSKHLQPGLPYSYTETDAFRIQPVAEGLGKPRADIRLRNTERYELRTADVLFMSRGTRNLATRLADIPSPSLAPVSFFVLRPKSANTVDPAYLTWYLNSAPMQNDISNIRTGAATPIVQRAVFQELTVPVPDIATQRKIGEVGELMMRESLMHEQLAAAVARGHDATSNLIRQQLLMAVHTSN